MANMIRNFMVVVAVLSSASFAGDGLQQKEIPQWTPVSVLLKTYDSNELKGDDLVKKPGVRLIGRMARIKNDLAGRPTLFLGDSELHSVRCIFGSASDQDMLALKNLSEGQLVAITGKGEGRTVRQVVVNDCHIDWVPTSKPETQQLLGQSLRKCAVDHFEKWAPEVATSRPKDWKRLLEERTLAVAWLEKEKKQAVSCSLISLWVPFSCDGEQAPECKDPAMRGILKYLKKE